MNRYAVTGYPPTRRWSPLFWDFVCRLERLVLLAKLPTDKELFLQEFTKRRAGSNLKTGSGAVFEVQPEESTPR